MKTYHDIKDFTYDEEQFIYQPELTQKLDASYNQPFTQELLNEIVLWKINRYALANEELIRTLQEVSAKSRELNEELTRRILTMLLTTKGVGLAMASTILRFRNPHVYQIIDQRAYRIAMGLPLKITAISPIEKQIAVYISYLRKLKEISIEKRCAFDKLDRVLYYNDKQLNKNITLSNYGSKKKTTE